MICPRCAATATEMEAIGHRPHCPLLSVTVACDHDDDGLRAGWYAAGSGVIAGPTVDAALARDALVVHCVTEGYMRDEAAEAEVHVFEVRHATP